MPERFVMAIHADLVGPLYRLPAVHAKLDQATDTDSTAGDGVIAARPVASFASAALEVVGWFELKQAPHLGLREVAREIEMTGVAVNAADVPGLREKTDVGIEVGGIRVGTPR